MPDVVGGGTTNVTLYDEDGVQLGGLTKPLRVLTVANPGQVLGVVQNLGNLYATTVGGNISYNTSIDVLGQSSTGEQLVAAVNNPTGSGVDLFIDSYELNASGTTTWRRYRNATLSGLGTAQVNVNRGGDTSKMGLGRVYRGPGSTTQPTAAQFAQSGGVLGKTSFIAANNPNLVNIEGSVRLRPGQNWVFTATGPGGLGGTQNVTFFLNWWESPAT